MKISASITSHIGKLEANVSTNGTHKELLIPPKQDGNGSSVNGGELLLLSLATCFCNDLYREAKKRNIEIRGVEVDVQGEFGAEGEPGMNFMYQVKLHSDAPPDIIRNLISDTDQVAEIHNTLRKGIEVTLLH